MQWVIAFAASIVINVPRQLNRHHHASDQVWRQVGAAIVLIVLVTLLFRLLFFSLSWYGERRERKRAGTPPLTPGDR
jgi:choline-glycine betaine transporter